MSGICNRCDQPHAYTDELIALIRRGNRAHNKMTRLQTAAPRDLGSISSKWARNFLFSEFSKPVLEPTQNSIHRYMADYLRRLKLSGCEAYDWLRFSAKIMNEWSYVSIPPYGFMSRTFTTFTFIILFSGADKTKCPKNVKIKRPPNAFLVFAKEMRRTVSFLYPQDNNKHISKR